MDKRYLFSLFLSALFMHLSPLPGHAGNVGIVRHAGNGGIVRHAAPDLFLPHVEFTTGSYPEAVAIGDVNGDGKKDVVLSTSTYMDPENDKRIHVFLQNERGKLTLSHKLPAGNGASLDIGDVNGDGRNDIAVSAANGVGIFIQTDEGTLRPMKVYPSNHESETNAQKVVIGDFNSDGRLDVASIDRGTESSDVDVYIQRKNGTLNYPISYPVDHGGMDDLVVGDVNNDGLSDIIVMSGSGIMYDNIGILIQNQRGSFNLPFYYDLGKSELTHGAAVGDVNGDDLQDLVVSYGEKSPSSFIGIFSQNDSGKLDTNVNCYPTGDLPNAVETGDLNFDGRDDVIVVHGGHSSLTVLLQDEEGSLSSHETYSLPHAGSYNPHGLDLGDINGDGATDVAIADHNHGLVVLYHSPPPDPMPDLIGGWTDLTVDYRDSTIFVTGSLDIKNAGSDEASDVTLAYYISDDPELDDRDTLFRTREVGTLPPGEIVDLQFDYLSEIYLQGDFIIVAIDPGNTTDERNESNNLMAIPMVQMTKQVREKEELQAVARRACPSTYCTNFIKKIKDFYR